MSAAVQTKTAHSWEVNDEAFFVYLSGDKAMNTTSSSVRTDDRSSRAQHLRAFFLTLAARRREFAEKTSNAQLADINLSVAAGYEALAETFSDLTQRQLAKDRRTRPRAGKPT